MVVRGESPKTSGVADTILHALKDAGQGQLAVKLQWVKRRVFTRAGEGRAWTQAALVYRRTYHFTSYVSIEILPPTSLAVSPVSLGTRLRTCLVSNLRKGLSCNLSNLV